MKHYCLKAKWAPSRPSLLWEVRLDIQDARSGYSGSDSGFFRGPLLDHADVDWTRDLVERVESSSLRECTPPHTISWPEVADKKLMRHLLQFYRIPLWKNYKLTLYSAPGESKKGFVNRCLSFQREERNVALQKVKDIFLRRFLELEQKFLRLTEDDELDVERKDQALSRIRDLFSDFRDGFSRCFLKESLVPLEETDLDWTGNVRIDFQERIDKLRADFVAQYNEIIRTSQQKAECVEVYEVPLAYSHVDIVSRGVLWN